MLQRWKNSQISSLARSAQEGGLLDSRPYAKDSALQIFCLAALAHAGFCNSASQVPGRRQQASRIVDGFFSLVCDKNRARFRRSHVIGASRGVAIFLMHQVRSVQPKLQFRNIGINRAPFAVPDTVYRQVQVALPPLDGAHPTIKVVRDFFPRIQDGWGGTLILARNGAPQ